MAVSVLYLHGWGASYPQDCPIAHELRRLLDDAVVSLHTPTYHPSADVKATRIERFLAEIAAEAQARPEGRFSVVVGCSFGGFLASLFQERFPHLVGRLVLLAPAIDNFARNYEAVPEAERRMPPDFVRELRGLPARPEIRVPAVVLHGLLDDDAGGSAPWRVQQWVAATEFTAAYFPEDVDHSLEQWLGAAATQDMAAPSMANLLLWALKPVMGQRLPLTCREEEALGHNLAWDPMPTA